MPAVHHILLVDDDQTLREALAEQLALYEEFKLSTAGTATAAVKAVQAERIDLAIMDVGLPDMDGREAVKLMRKNGFKSPVIMLTGQGSDADTVLGLEAGANDYVVKPFKFAVLLARLRAHLRQYEASEDAVFQVGPYTFHPGSKLLVSEKGSKTKLTEKETAILRFLYRAGRKPIAREVLLQEVWGYNSQVTTHTLETHIYRLRQKIEPDPGNARLLVTDAGGYRLNPKPVALDDDIALLARQPLLSLMERDALRLVAFAAESRILRAGDVLFRMGEPSDGGVLIISGTIALTSREDGQPAEEVVEAGALIGEMALFTSVARPATAIAREPTQVMRLSRSVMRRVLAESPASAEAVATAIGDRLRGFVGELTAVQDALRAIDRTG